MRANRVEIPYQEGLTYNLHTLADIHVGNANCAKDKFEARVQEIANDPLGLWVLNGDAGDFITYTDKRFDPATIDWSLFDSPADLAKLPAVYVEYLTEHLYPIRDKCVCVTWGTHEYHINRMHQENPLWLVTKNLGATDRWGDWACITTLTFKDKNKHHDSFDIYQSHGHQASRKGGALVNALDDMMGWINCDLLLQAHSHQYLIKHKVRLYSEDGEIRQKVQIGAHTGSFLMTYKQDKTSQTAKGYVPGSVSYAERGGFPPTVLGTPTFRITPSRYGHGEVSA